MTDALGSPPDGPPGQAANRTPRSGAAEPWAAPGSHPGPTGEAGPPSADGPTPPAFPPPVSPVGSRPDGQPYGHQPGPGSGGPAAPPGYGPPAGPGGFDRPIGYPAQGPFPYGPAQVVRPGIIPLRPLGLDNILDGAFSLIRTHPKATLGGAAIAAVATYLPSLLSDAFRLTGLGGVSLTSTSGAALYLEAVVPFAFGLVGLIVLTGFLTRIAGRAVVGAHITMSEAWRLVRGRIPTLIGLVVLQGLILALPLITAFVVFGVFPDEEASSFADMVAILLRVIAIFVLYLPLLAFVTTKLALAPTAAVLEERGPLDAMRRSWRLVKGGSWRVFGIILLTNLIGGVIGFALAMPFQLAAGALMMTLSSSALAVLGQMVSTLGGILSMMVIYPFQAGVSVLLYVDRRIRTEAFDLVLRMAATRTRSPGSAPANVDEVWHPSYAATADAPPPPPSPGSAWPYPPPPPPGPMP